MNGQGSGNPAALAGDVHRMGGGNIDNLRLKPAETSLAIPGISVLMAATAGDAATQMRAAFPNAPALHELCKTVGTTTNEQIRSVGFDLMPDPTRKFSNYCRLIHPNGAAGFADRNLLRLSGVLTDSTGH